MKELPVDPNDFPEGTGFLYVKPCDLDRARAVMAAGNASDAPERLPAEVQAFLDHHGFKPTSDTPKG
jgi:hypothetical protein